MITIGIPTYNEEKVIAKAVNSVLPQISENDEVIVVASGCTDNTVSEIKKIKDKRLRLIIEKEKNGKASAINIIIKESRGDIIISTDGDVCVEQNSISKLLPHFKDETIGGVSGNPIPIIPKNNLFYDWTIMSYRKIGEERAQEVENKTFNVHLSGYLMAFRKKALPEIPASNIIEDAVMGKLIKDKGYKLTYEPEATVLVKAPLNIKDFLIQKARNRAGYVSLREDSPRHMKKEIFYFPGELLKIPIWRWHKFIASGFIYTYSWFLGYCFAKTNKPLKKIWKEVKSTKY